MEKVLGCVNQASVIRVLVIIVDIPPTQLIEGFFLYRFTPMTLSNSHGWVNR